VCLVSIVLAAPAAGQWDAQAFEDHMRQSRKKALEKRDSALSTLLDMSKEQSKIFRPVQQSYDRDLKALGKKQQALTREFGKIFDKLTADTASGIAEKFFELQRERLAIQQKYFKQISDEVSPVIAVQFTQLQRRFETEIDMERMKYSPLAE
jgi:hypothetical protein